MTSLGPTRWSQAMRLGAALLISATALSVGAAFSAEPSSDEAKTPITENTRPVRVIGTPPPFTTSQKSTSGASESPESNVAQAVDQVADQGVETPVDLAVDQTYDKPDSGRVARDDQPYMMVRLLQDLQAQTAKGSTHALRAQRSLLARMNDQFAKIDPVVWEDQRNIRAVTLFMLSGGHPAIGTRLLEMDLPNHVDTSLISASLAYIKGQKSDAYRGFSALDPLQMEPSLGGQIALVQAVLFLPHDLNSALEAVDKARLLMPGSLIEEAALRRGVSIAAAMKDPELFQTYAIQYIRHYHNSIYNSDFRRRFGFSMRRFGTSENEQTFADLDIVISEFDLDSQRQFYLLLAHAGLVEGNLHLALQAATKALPLTMKNTADRSRAELYIAGSMLKAETLDQALEHLWAVRRKDLDPRDMLLAERVTEILNGIRHWPEAKEALSEFADKDVDPVPENKDWELDTMTDARKQLEQADDILSYADKPMKQASR
ncbi:chemotaxis protein MotC [Cohaesibacter sp. ES.047]|uniref:chemotaxis protein n=1 Tax=Cohaesibacter sp. ES.047 TaxID=1798205 RepID=UPI000BB8BC0B|nr:chemotaxis protein [Cohaesibacter sp. ES.047]SNY92153.1 chemotaxis protein MotC [Cohaesibacter sp. ES.047]